MVLTLPRAVVPSCHCRCVVRGQKSGLSRCYTASALSVLSVHIHTSFPRCVAITHVFCSGLFTTMHAPSPQYQFKVFPFSDGFGHLERVEEDLLGAFDALSQKGGCTAPGGTGCRPRDELPAYPSLGRERSHALPFMVKACN